MPNAGRVRAQVTRMEALYLVRLLHGNEGVYVAVAPGASVDDLVEAVEPVMRSE